MLIEAYVKIKLGKPVIILASSYIKLALRVFRETPIPALQNKDLRQES